MNTQLASTKNTTTRHPLTAILDPLSILIFCSNSLSPHISAFVVSGPDSVQWSPSADSITRYHAHLGDDFYGFWCEGCRYLVVNRCGSLRVVCLGKCTVDLMVGQHTRRAVTRVCIIIHWIRKIFFESNGDRLYQILCTTSVSFVHPSILTHVCAVV